MTTISESKNTLELIIQRYGRSFQECFYMKKLIPAIIAAALLSGCATQNDAVALSNRISDQQKQINALSVRLSLPSILE